MPCSVAWAVFQKLSVDKADDLYFDGGEDRRLFLSLLATGRVKPALLLRMLELGGPSHTRVWQEILRTAFAAFTSFAFDSDRAAFDRDLMAVRHMTTPAPLVRLLTGMLLGEAVAAASQWPSRDGVDGPAWERKSVLAPLLRVSTWVNVADVLRAVSHGDALPGLMPAALRQARGYPVKRCDL